MTAFRAFVVVNPRSAGGSTAVLWPEIRSALEASIGPFSHEFTAAPGDGTRLAARALREGYEMVVAVGGDGTVNEVVNGFFEPGGAPIRTDAVLGTIARGTGKDFIRTAGIPRDLAAAARALGGERTVPWDVGRLSVERESGPPVIQYFVNESDFGMGGEIARAVNNGSKRMGGFLSFLWATLCVSASYRAKPVTLLADGAEVPVDRIHSVVVAVGRFGGGGMNVAPTAVPDDGLFDLVIVDALGPLELLGNLPRLYRGTILQHPKVRHLRCASLEARSRERVAIGVDGESHHFLPARFDLLPRAIRVKVP